MEVDDAVFETSDGVRLHYMDAGQGRTLVMHPAWTFPATSFHKQIAALSSEYRVVALDPRGHGDSEKPAFGYRLSRLAADLHELLQHLQVEDAVLFGHSAGCAVLWTYFDSFGEDRVRGWVFCDQMIARLRRPEWSDEEADNYGAEVDAATLLTAAHAIAGPEGEALARGFLRGMFTPAFPESEAVAVIEETLKMPRPAAGDYLRAVGYGDFRDVLPRLERPALVFGGGASHLNSKAMPWIAAKIPDARLVMVPAEEGGSHFMFLENPALVNAALRDFLGSVFA